jgi:hypothetical protein
VFCGGRLYLRYGDRFGAPGQYSDSPVVANGHLYVASNRGVVSVVTTGDSFRMAYQRDLGEPVIVTPAVDASTLYLRTETHLLAFQARE